VAKLIQLDPALTARIISVVNSAAFGGLKKIRTVHQATSRLGRRKVRSLVYSCLLKGIFKINSRNLKRRMEALWQHSAYVAALSFVLGRETPGIDPEQALLAGLIHDIGSVAVIGGINRYPLLAKRPEVLDYAIASLRLEAGMLTIKSWNLEDEFADVIQNADNWYRIGTAIPDNTDVVILAQLHALIGKQPQGAIPAIDEVPAFAKLAHGDLTPRQSLSLLEEAESDVREVRALIGVG
jgi:HD-like signal output (HDOD) protein